MQFPALVWVIQKFAFSRGDFLKPINVVLNKKLEELPNPKDNLLIAQRNYTVRTIKTSFKDQEAFFIPPATKNTDYFNVTNIHTHTQAHRGFLIHSHVLFIL